jgi:hypothetical protein
MATAAHTWTDRAAGLAWQVHSSTRATWHLVTLDHLGGFACTCEWWQNEGYRLKDCKHVAAVRAGDPALPRPHAAWTDETADADGEPYPTAREWAERLAGLRAGTGCGWHPDCGYETPDHPGKGPWAGDPDRGRREGAA